ncbi:hypothetical protein BX265_8492 [Streptomyces sp. TLI_235]|nr:hypothetical protein BX265_8492 [Streptomyces sp. TLI_235]
MALEIDLPLRTDAEADAEANDVSCWESCGPDPATALRAI